MAAAASFLACIYLRCLKPCDPSGPNGCLITLLGCLLSSGWEILVGLKEDKRKALRVGKMPRVFSVRHTECSVGAHVWQRSSGTILYPLLLQDRGFH